MNAFQPRPIALSVAVALGTWHGPVWAAAGRVQFAFGEATLVSAGGGRSALGKGDEVDSGDTVRTERGRVQIRFTDGGLVSLQPRTTFKIDDYNFDGSSDGSERGFFSLLRGGFRTITGAIGRRDKSRYRVNTPVATIGIRGTEYLIVLDESGAVITVGDGAIAVVNDAGEVILENGQTGRVVDRSTLPQLTEEKASLPPPQKDLRNREDGPEPIEDSKDFQVVYTGDQGDPEAVDNITDDELMVGGSAATKLETGAGYVVGFTYLDLNDEGQPRKDTVGPTDAVFSSGQLTAFSGGLYALDELTLVDAGSDRYIGWGRWSNTSGASADFVVNGGPEFFDKDAQSLHYVVGRPTENLSLAAMGEAQGTYELLSFTRPTETDGTLASIVQGSAAFGLDFTAQTVTGGISIDSTTTSERYALDFGPLPVTGGTFQGSAVVQDTFSFGCFCACAGSVSGLVAGPAADRAGFAYHINDQFNTDIFGAVTFRRTGIAAE